MTTKKKIAASIGAVGMAAVIALGGTFAWQSISQQALNETMATVNPAAVCTMISTDKTKCLR